MKTVFIINPMAGKKKNIEKISALIRQLSEKHGKETEIYITKCVGDARRFVREYCENKGCARFVACGGDGTFGEVLCGAIDFKGCELGIVPMGTGNDFCRNFPDDIDFCNIEGQFFGNKVKCDAIKYTMQTDCGITERYCANMFNIGFDCNVADMTSQMKKRPFISGSLAYLLSVFVMLIKKKGANLEVEIDGQTVHKGDLLLTSIANGCFCGGGIKSNPTACVNDGIMDINIINNISRLNFLTKLPFYMKGTHTKLKGIEKIITAYRGKHIVISPLNGTMRLCVDGEITDAGKTEFQIVKDDFTFVLPSVKVKSDVPEKEIVTV